MNENKYPFGEELHRNMKKHVSLPIKDVDISTFKDEFVTVRVEVIMTRDQIKELFNEPVTTEEWKPRTSDDGA